MDSKLTQAVNMAVPLVIAELKEKGGPTEEDFKQATEYGRVLAEKGDTLLFGSNKKGEAADLFNRLCHSIAVMSFLPGGVTIFGEHHESREG